MMLFWGVRCFKRMVVLKAWNAWAMFVSHEPTRLSETKVWQHNLWSWREKYTVDSGQLASRSHNFHLSFRNPLKLNTSCNASQEFLPSYAFLLHPLSHLQGLLPVVWRGQATQKSIVTLKAARYQVSVVRSKTRHLVVPATGPWKNTCLGSKKPLALFCWPWWPPWQRQQKHSMFVIYIIT